MKNVYSRLMRYLIRNGAVGLYVMIAGGAAVFSMHYIGFVALDHLIWPTACACGHCAEPSAFEMLYIIVAALFTLLDTLMWGFFCFDQMERYSGR